MSRMLISTGSPFEEMAGYSRAVVEGNWCFVSGTTGYDYATMTMPEGVAAQAANALSTIEDTLEKAGFSKADIVRVQYTITDPALAEDVFAVTGPFFTDIKPAATMVVAGLIRPEMLVEIEVTALRRG